MAKIIFITGGVHSGKARWAVNYFGAMDYVMYMSVYDEMDKETADRIEFNCDKYGISWDIRTGVSSLNELFKGHKFAILDNLSEYVNRVIAQKALNLANLSRDERMEIEKEIIEEVIELIWEVKEVNGILLILSAELGFSTVPCEPEQAMYRKILGTVNQRLANQATEVYLLVSGIHMKIK
ncbi:MAG: bifunctional adenosylcobinamide kinase/adenosylcobinamide-phosphate guanylyltransferase [Defluviitaleaceae bacterium]|nr:bifunctional adenosylcobinamide kinase/adenosylcobinamide-phosphate guanylyltransferase [Defluviitaleaceae bacterium]